MSEMQPFLEQKPETQTAWQARLAEGGCFILAESALNEAVAALAEQWGGSLEQTCLYWGETARIHGTLSPFVIPVHPGNWPQTEEQLLTQAGWGIGIQLEWFMRAYTPLEQLRQLQAHLRQWSLVATPAGEIAILRISDWQTIVPLLAASSLQEATAFYGPVSAWWRLPPDGEAEVLRLKQRVAHQQFALLPRRLSEAQWQAILAPAENYQLARFMAHLRQHHARWRDSEETTLRDFILQQQELAYANGFNNERDVVRWLALATELKPAFITTAWAQKILREPEYIGLQSRMDRIYQHALTQLENA